MKADAVICGAGIAGIAAAWHLVQRAGFERIVLLERDAPLALTSDKSTECYRNWWQGPGDAMVRLANRSIELLEGIAGATDNAIRLDRRGYLFLSGEPQAGERLAEVARESQALGAGALRVHERDDGRYRPGSAGDYRAQPDGSDLILDRALIARAFPYATPRATAALHVRRAGALSAQQLGMVLLDRARAAGVELLHGDLVGLDLSSSGVRCARVERADGALAIETRHVVNAAGPYFPHVGRLAGLELPVVCERHAKLTFSDRHAVLPRDAPLSIWCDATRLPWSDDERAALEADAESAYLTAPFPPGVHGRPVGAGTSVMLYWTYDCPVEEPAFPVAYDPHYPEILMRGMSVMVPGLSAYRERIPNAYVDGGYYAKTRENRPLVGPTPVEGFHLMGAFSGFGIMTAMAAGELLADHLSGAALPPYAPALALERYQRSDYRRLLEEWPSSGQI